MGQALETVEHYMDALTKKQSGWRNYVTNDVTFAGPIAKANGIAELTAVNDGFTADVQDFEVLKRFEHGSDVCSIYRFAVQTPKGEPLSFDFVEWATVADGKNKSMKGYCDGREFAAAFGM
jgi:hypothetical protein